MSICVSRQGTITFTNPINLHTISVLLRTWTERLFNNMIGLFSIMFTFSISCYFCIHSIRFVPAINMLLLIRRKLFYIDWQEEMLNHYTFPQLQENELCFSVSNNWDCELWYSSTTIVQRQIFKSLIQELIRFNSHEMIRNFSFLIQHLKTDQNQHKFFKVIYLFGLLSLFNGISIFIGYLIPNPFL